MRKIACSARVAWARIARATIVWATVAFLSTVPGFAQSSVIQTVVGGGLPQNILATSASLGYVSGVATYAGSFYVSLQAYAAVVKVDPSGNLTLVAGAGTPGFSGDGGPSTSAKLNNPQGLAVNSSNGDLYIADAGNNRIRKVSGGIITTLVGGGAISLANPYGVAVDNGGNVYIADTGSNVVRKWSNGVVTTVAGTGTGGFNNYTGSATATSLFGPRSVAVDTFGNLYIADYTNDLIRKVTAAGALTSVLDVLGPMAVAVDAAGDVFVASAGSDVVGELATSGLISVFAGDQTLGYIGDGGVATGAELNTPAGLAVDPASGNVFIADFNNFVVREVANGVIYTVAGSLQGFVGDNGSPLGALLLKPIGTAIGPSGELYIADTNHNRIRKVLNGVITTVAGTGSPGYSGDNGPATSAQLNSPWGVAVDSSGDLFISDLGNSVVRFVNASTGAIVTVAGVAGTAGYNADSIVANTAYLNAPAGIALDSSKNLYIADFGNHRIRQVAQATGMITTVAGTGTGGYNGDGIAATTAELLNPVDVKLDTSGNLYIADHGNNLIRKISGGNITTIAGLASNSGGAGGYSGDGGPATSAQLNAPFGVGLDSTGDLFIADSGNNVIREVTGGTINTIAGNTVAGYSGDLGPPAGASLNSPLAVTVSSAGLIYVSDSGNNLIRAISSTSGLVCTALVTPLSVQSGASGGSVGLTVQTPPACAWTIANLPSWITAPGGSSGTGTGSASLVIAPDPGASRSATISVAGISVAVNQAACTYAISPGGQIFPAVGGTGTITVTTSSACARTVANTNTWITFTGAGGGTGSGTLTFTVGSASTAATGRSGTFTVAGLTFTVDQQAGAIAGLSLIGSMPHIAAQENWTTTFTMVNNTNASNEARLSLFGSNIDATGSGNPLPLSLTFPQQSGAPSLLGASVDNALAPFASWIVGTAQATAGPVQTGSAQVQSTGALGGFAIFHRISDSQEAVVPLTAAAPSAPSYLLAYDNTGGIVTAVAVANVSPNAASVAYVIRDDTGAAIGSGSLALPATGQTSFDLPDPSLGLPVTAGKRGTVEFDTPVGGEISVLGIRNTPQVTASGNVTTLTTVPALANVGTGGGSFAFLASGGDGWQTTFALVNTSSAAAPVTLNFFDPNGNPLPLPISFPQVGATVSTASSVTQTLAAGATLLIQSTGAPTLLTGSAQLVSTGNVSGFVIFRHNGQEAVVPMENRNASGYVLAFDNTAGTATGVAVNNVSSSTSPVNIPVVIRDDQGNQLATDTLSVAANGDLSFTLVKDKYPQTANIRGTIEFDAPGGVQIGAVGIRAPAALTYTSLPALAK
jgi:sugar lactone lactonase YvrE